MATSSHKAGEPLPRDCAEDCHTCARLRRAAVEAGATFGIAALGEEALAEAAGISVDAVREHGPGSAAGWLAATYVGVAKDLQRNFAIDFAPARTWHDGVRWATEGLVRTLAEDPALARFCYVEVLNAGNGLRLIRERVRRDSIGLFEREYVARHGAEAVPHGRLELSCNVIIYAISEHAREGRAAELPAALDAMLVAAGGVLPTFN